MSVTQGKPHSDYAIKIAFVLITLFALTSFSHAVVIIYDNPPFTGEDPVSPGGSWIEYGFRMQNLGSVGSALIRWNPSALPGVLPNNGTVYMAGTYSSAPHMDRTDDQLFSISQIDLSSYSASAQTSTIRIRGNFADGNSITNTFAIPGWDGAFHTYMFGSQWTNLKSMDILTAPAAWDNVVVNVVPEPTTCSLLALGVLVLLSTRRLRRRST